MVSYRAVVSLLLGLQAASCSCPPPLPGMTPAVETPGAPDLPAEREAITEVVDGWHAAAARADEEAYFDAMTEDAVFLGTDATERWDKAAFRAYAHPHFAKGKAWSFRAVRRDLILDDRGRLAWFDEDLIAPNLGPARGSGVLRKERGRWRIAHYNLAITVPNERFGEVKALLDAPTREPEPEPEAPEDSAP